MKISTFLLGLFLCASMASAQTSRFLTLHVDAALKTNEPPCFQISGSGNPTTWVTNEVPCQPFMWGSNGVVLTEFETAKFITVSGGGLERPNVSFRREGRWFYAAKGDVIQGPALLAVSLYDSFREFYNDYQLYGLVTFELLPQAFPPDRTLLLPQGSNTVAVALECSTNLVNWQTASNGLYGTPDAAKFFRIRAER